MSFEKYGFYRGVHSDSTGDERGINRIECQPLTNAVLGTEVIISRSSIMSCPSGYVATGAYRRRTAVDGYLLQIACRQLQGNMSLIEPAVAVNIATGGSITRR